MRAWTLHFGTRLQLVIAAVAAGVVVLMVSVEAVTDYREALARFDQEARAVVQTLSGGVGPALRVGRDADARRVIQTVRNMPSISAAHLFDPSGACITSYRRLRADALPRAEAVLSPERTRRGAFVQWGEPVVLDGRVMGSLVVTFNRTEIAEELTEDAFIAAVLALASLVGAWLAAYWLRRVLGAPVMELARVAQQIAETRDYSVRAPRHNDDELGRLTDSFNHMLAQIEGRDHALSRARDELAASADSLRESEARTRAIIGSAADAIITFDTAGMIEDANPAAAEIFGIDAGVLAGRPINELLDAAYSIDERGHVLHAGEGTRPTRDLGRHAEALAVHRDGHAVPIQVGISRCEYGGRELFIAVARDVTATQRAQAERDELNRRLLDASREAGMAEVATGVLHNVGNVLNSVNVSAGLMLDRLRTSKLHSLGKAVRLIEQRRDDLIAFITQDERGRHLPQFLIQVATVLQTDHDAMLKELSDLTANVEHIKQIVKTQQNYAKVAGVVEPVHLSQLVEDALRINTASLQKHGVQTVKEFEALPPVPIDKHRVLQVLVNLISNARHAMDGTPPDLRRLTIRTGRSPINSTRVRIEVGDTGVGIPAENLTRIFHHGFTTRSDGHGFGLHSGALIAKEMGGSLTAASQGPGRGATFTLELPLTVPEELSV